MDDISEVRWGGPGLVIGKKVFTSFLEKKKQRKQHGKKLFNHNNCITILLTWYSF